jgi:radical SAM superfamily enzyme YgiQ (UPF0313 family)
VKKIKLKSSKFGHANINGSKITILLFHIPEFSCMDSETFIMSNGLLWLWSYLKENFISVKLINLGTRKRDFLTKKIKKYNPKFIGISLYSYNRLKVADICLNIKKEFPNIKLILGGPQVSSNLYDLKNNWLFIDKFIIGRGEMELVEYIKSNDNKVAESFENSFILEQNSKKIKKKIFKNNDKLIDRENSFISSKWLCRKSPANYGVLYENIITATGCPGKCIFCSSPMLWKNKIDFRSIESIVEEIKILFNNNINQFVFSDDTFTLNFKRIEKIFLNLKKENIFFNWDARTRADFITKEQLLQFRHWGCSSLSFGIESADRSVLNRSGKNIDIDKCIENIKFASDIGIYVNLFFIIGLPGETDETLNKNIDFIKKVKPQGITVHILHFISGSGLEKQFGKCNWVDLNEKQTFFFDEESSIDVLIKRKNLIEAAAQKYFRDLNLQELEKLNKKFPGQPDLIFNLAQKHELNNNLDRAKMLYERSIEISFVPQTSLSLALLIRKQDQNSLKSKELIIKTINKINFLTKNGIKINENSYFIRALCHIENYNYEKALSDLNICLDFNPRNVVVLEQVIWACMNLEKDDMALKYLNIIPVFERNQMWYFNSIVANLNTGYKKRATKLLNKALKIWPDNNDLKQLYYEC